MDPNFSEVFHNFDLSRETGGNPSLREQLKHALTDGGKSQRKNRAHRVKSLPNTPRALRDEILKTLPRDVEAYRVDYFQIPLCGGENFPFFIIKGFIPKDRVDELLNWRNNFEKLHGITVFPQIRNVPKTLKDEFSELTSQSGLITREALPALKKAIEMDPPLETLPLRNLQFEDRRNLKWFSIDGPEVKNREDILCVERERGGVRLYIGFADQSMYLPPDSPIEKYGRKRINALPSRNHSPTVVGHCIAGDVSNFIEGKERYAWVVEVFLGDDGSIREEDPYRAAVVNEKAYVNGEFTSSAPSSTRELLSRAIDRLPKTRGVEAKRRTSTGHSEILVSKAMVFAKSKIARFLDEKGVPALYRNHQAPEKKNIMRLVQAYRELGIPAEFDDFTDPLRLAALCRILTTRDTLSLLSATLSLIYFPSTVSFHPEEHAGVGADRYCEIKPHKNYAGMFNEYSLGHACYGEPLPSFALDPAKRRNFEREMNLAIQTRDLDAYRYVRIKAILSGLSKSKVYSGVAGKDGSLEVLGGSFSRFEKIGIKCKLAGSSITREGDSLRVQAIGFDPESGHFVFKRVELSEGNSKRNKFLNRSKNFRGKRGRFRS